MSPNPINKWNMSKKKVAKKKVAKKKVAKKKKVDLDSWENELQNRHTVKMLAIQIFKEVSKELDIGCAVLPYHSEPAISFTYGKHKCTLVYESKSSHLSFSCSDVCFAVTLNDNYIEVIKEILGAMHYYVYCLSDDDKGDYY